MCNIAFNCNAKNNLIIISNPKYKRNVNVIKEEIICNNWIKEKEIIM